MNLSLYLMTINAHVSLICIDQARLAKANFIVQNALAFIWSYLKRKCLGKIEVFSLTSLPPLSCVFVSYASLKCATKLEINIAPVWNTTAYPVDKRQALKRPEWKCPITISSLLKWWLQNFIGSEWVAF